MCERSAELAMSGVGGTCRAYVVVSTTHVYVLSGTAHVWQVSSYSFIRPMFSVEACSPAPMALQRGLIEIRKCEISLSPSYVFY
jgi:hypothetical protein